MKKFSNILNENLDSNLELYDIRSIEDLDRICSILSDNIESIEGSSCVASISNRMNYDNYKVNITNNNQIDLENIDTSKIVLSDSKGIAFKIFLKNNSVEKQYLDYPIISYKMSNIDGSVYEIDRCIFNIHRELRAYQFKYFYYRTTLGNKDTNVTVQIILHFKFNI